MRTEKKGENIGIGREGEKMDGDKKGKGSEREVK